MPHSEPLFRQTFRQSFENNADWALPCTSMPCTSMQLQTRHISMLSVFGTAQGLGKHLGACRHALALTHQRPSSANISHRQLHFAATFCTSPCISYLRLEGLQSRGLLRGRNFSVQLCFILGIACNRGRLLTTNPDFSVQSVVVRAAAWLSCKPVRNR